MNRFNRLKKTKVLLKFLAFSALFGTITATVSYGLFNITNNNSNSKQIGLSNQDATVSNQPTINDIVNGDVSSLSQPITTSNGDFILPTLNSNNTPGLIKLNSFVSGLYGINFDNFANYHVRQIVQNYNDQNQYFVLLVSNETSVTASYSPSPTPPAIDTSDIKFTITNPGHILSVLDTGTNFKVNADYQLDSPILDSTLNAYYKGMYFQPPLTPTTQQAFNSSTWINNPWFDLSPNDLAFTEAKQTTTSDPGSGTYLYTNKTIMNSSSLKHLNESWIGYTQNIATLLYLNSLNNMVFVSNKVNNSGSDVIYLFGGNKYINLWFYTFYVNNQQPTTAPIVEYASGYANYGFHWGAVAPTAPNTRIASSDLVTQKAYNFKLKVGDTGPSNNKSSSWDLKKYPDASFFGYYVAGAKFVNKPNPQILLTLTIPNFTLAGVDKPIIFTTNAYYLSWSAYEQNPAALYVNYYGSIPVDLALQTTSYRQQQVDDYTTNNTWKSSSTWYPRYTNYQYTFMNYLSWSNGEQNYSVTPDANDGMQSKAYNKLVAYIPEDIGNNNIALSYNRSNMQATISTKDGTTSTSAKLSLYQSDTRLGALSNISYTDQTWFLWFNDKDDSGATKTVIYFFTYDDLTNQVLFSQTNLFSDNGSEILNILPLNKDYIYVLSRKSVDASSSPTKSNYEVTPLLYHLSDIKGNYNQNLQYNKLVTDPSVPKINGIPAYSDANGFQNDDQKAIWGTVTFKDIDYISKAGFLENPASFLADDPSALQTLVSYQPGWEGQDFKVTATADANNQLQLSVSIKYFNGQYFSPQQLLPQNALSDLTQTYGGFSALPNWVLPVAIAVPILFLAIILALGLGLGIPMARTRKLQDKGFTQTFKKVDTLTSAVGSVYKKIITETSTVKKKPQMLKSATKSIKKPEGVKPPVSSAPGKPIAKAPVGLSNPNVANVVKPKAPAPTAPIKPNINRPNPGFPSAPKKPM